MKKIVVFSLLALLLSSNTFLNAATSWTETLTSLPSAAFSNAVALPGSAWKKATASKTNMTVTGVAALGVAYVLYRTCNNCPEVRALLGLDSKKTKKVKPAARIS